jgi:hypothetical protein
LTVRETVYTGRLNFLPWKTLMQWLVNWCQQE